MRLDKQDQDLTLTSQLTLLAGWRAVHGIIIRLPSFLGQAVVRIAVTFDVSGGLMSLFNPWYLYLASKYTLWLQYSSQLWTPPRAQQPQWARVRQRRRNPA